jgi:hypothetical protein
MKPLPALLLCASVLGCAASTPVSRGDRRGTRLALLLSTVLLMGPGALDALPETAATSP